MHAEKIGSLKTILPESVSFMEEAPEWEEIEMVVDCGATESVMEPRSLKSAPIKEGAAKQKNANRDVANGQGRRRTRLIGLSRAGKRKATATKATAPTQATKLILVSSRTFLQR